jgi:uncharacterized membrane protein
LATACQIGKLRKGNQMRAGGSVRRLDPRAGPVKLVDFLQGKWLGHPLHPAIVHVPIGAWIAACVLDILAFTRWHQPAFSRLAFYCVALGLAVVLAAVPTGLAEWTAIKKEKPAWRLALYHLILNVLATAAWTVNFALRARTIDTSEPVSQAILVTSIAGTLLVLIGGYLGSLMVFDQGIAVARLSKKKWRAIAARGGARLPEEK